MSTQDTFIAKKLTKNEFEALRTALKPLVLPLEQTPFWGAFDDAIAGRTFLGSFRYDDTDGKLVAVASATLYEDRGRNWIWVKHGPLFASAPNTDTQKKLCRTLRTQFQNLSQQPLFIRITMPQKVAPLVLPFEHTMYDQTIVADLSSSEEELFAKMSQSGRQGIRKADKAEVAVEEISKDVAAYFAKHCYPILEETSQRDGFGIHPLATYTAMLELLGEHVQLFVSKAKDGAVAAWAITTLYDNAALYYYGGSSRLAHETSAAYLLHWEIMKRMKQRGAATYDFMGIAGRHYPALKNVTQFKLKFSKNIVSLPVTYDLPLRALRYRALALAIKTKRRLKR